MTRFDVSVCIMAALALAIVATAAAIWPSYRATRANPIETLRVE